MSRFTVHGSDQLETIIFRQLSCITDDVLRRLPLRWVECLVLGGGYGRGEGGARIGEDGTELPHNDYDLLLVHRIKPHSPAARTLRTTLAAIERKHGRATGIHVDIMPVHQLRVRHLPPALTWYELGRGHRVLWGSPRSLNPLVRRKLSQVHPTEWGRLLVNRAAGLAFARWVRRGIPSAIAHGEDPNAFVTRQIQKAWLALGDVWLADRNAYHHLVQKRIRYFEALHSKHPPWADAYRRAVTYKLAPTPTLSPQAQNADLAQLAELYVPKLLERQAAPQRPGVGLLATLRHVPPGRWLSLRPWAYPRERLRLALAAELMGDRRGFERFVSDPNSFIHLWRRYG